jgi:hypothetical protein
MIDVSVDFLMFGVVVRVASVRPEGAPLARAGHRLGPVDHEGVQVADCEKRVN